MIRHKARRSVLLATVLAALLVVGASSADAHTAQITIYDGTLVYQQIPGIDVNYDNDVTIALKTDSTRVLLRGRRSGQHRHVLPRAVHAVEPRPGGRPLSGHGHR